MRELDRTLDATHASRNLPSREPIVELHTQSGHNIVGPIWKVSTPMACATAPSSRKKIEEDRAEPKFILTERSVGYVFAADVEAVF